MQSTEPEIKKLTKFDEFSLTTLTGTVPFPVASGAAVEFPADVTADEAARTEVCPRLTFSLEESRKMTWLTAWPLATCKSYFKKKKTLRKKNSVKSQWAVYVQFRFHEKIEQK